MKKNIFFAILVLSALAVSSCRQADELPPIDKGYAKNFILPEPVNLTPSDRAYLDELQEEYDRAVNEEE